jgi:hypothetical protein
MKRMGWSLAELTSQLLEPHEREAVRGDLVESHVSGWRALREVLGLVARRQASLWAEWRPWLAMVGVVLPLGILLSHASRWWSDSTAHDISLYVRLWDWSYLSYPGWRREFLGSVRAAVLSAAALSVWSWTCGYMLASVSRRTVWVAAMAFALVVFFSTLGARPFARFSQDTFAGHFNGVILPRLVRTAFVLVPLFWGIHSRCTRVIPAARLLAVAAVVMTLTVLKSPGLENSLALGRGLYRNAGPDRTYGTSDDPRPLWPIALVMLWPTAYILATAMHDRPRRVDA